MVHKSFIEGLHSYLQTAWKKSGFKGPTPVQSRTIPLAMDGSDVIVESPTGTGKTVAYLLPLLTKIEQEEKATQGVILAPSRELVMQINEEVQKWSEGSGISKASFIGGANIKRQIEKLKKHPQIVIGTPGRIMELIKMKKLKMHKVKTVVLDEADQLLVPEHRQLIQQIIKSTLKERQIMLFSATLPASIEEESKDFMEQPEVVRIKTSDTHNKVEHLYIKCEQRDKIDVLRRLIRMQELKALAFVKDIPTLSVISEKLKFQGIELGVLDSDSSKQEREASLRKLRNGDIPIVLATDLAARGLDIDNLSHVIHFDLPIDKGQYIHRSGRTGRMGAVGTVLSIVTNREERVLLKYARDLNLQIKQKMLYKGQIQDPINRRRG